MVSPSAIPFGQTASARGKSPQLSGHQLHLLQGGAEFFPALVQAMDAATRLVHVETYIFEFAGSALSVAQAMERAARRGVAVRLVVDGVGTPTIPDEWRNRFRVAGVHWRVYAPLGRLGLLIPSRWRRLHRKLCVVDGTVGFCGGINLIDDQHDVALGRLTAPRLDYSLQVAGPMVADMLFTMEQLWWRLIAARKVRQREFKAAWETWRVKLPHGEHTGLPGLPGQAGVAGTQATQTTDHPPGDATREADQGPTGFANARAVLLLRDNVTHRHDIERAYLKAIGESRRSIIIANAYFIPGRKLRRALTMAAKRGVQVRLLLQGKYEHFMQYRAARPVYQALLRAGIEIHEYAPSALHAKVAVVDQRWATVGSTNLDPLSLLLAREANVMTSDERFSVMLHRRLEITLQQAGHALDLQQLEQRPRLQKLLDAAAFLLMRLSLFLTGHRY